MKKSILLVGLTMASLSTFAQGFIDFSWFAAGQPTGTGITVGSPSNPASQQPGWYLGGDYSVEAYMAAGASQAESSLAAIASTRTTFFGTTTTAAGGPTVNGEGYFGLGLANTGLPVGTGTIEVRAWYDPNHNTTYESALAAGLNTGKSAILNIPLADNTGTPSSLDTVGMQAFTVSGASVTPEPSTFALAGLGAAAALIFRRRK